MNATITRAEAADVLEAVADQILATVQMVETDHKDLNLEMPESMVLEFQVKRALVKSLKMRANVWRSTCRNGSCAWKPEDLVK